MAPSVPSRRSSQDGVARRFASLALHTACLWRRRSPRFARHMTALLIASLLALHTACACGAVSPLLRSSHDSVARYFASLALQGAAGPFASLVTRRRRSLLRFSCVANGVCLGRRRSLRFARHMRRRSWLRFSCVAYRVCPWRRQSPRFARHMTASLIASLLLRWKRRVPVAPSVPSLRSSHDGVAHCIASLALQTVCDCGTFGPFASLVT